MWKISQIFSARPVNMLCLYHRLLTAMQFSILVLSRGTGLMFVKTIVSWVSTLSGIPGASGCRGRQEWVRWSARGFYGPLYRLFGLHFDPLRFPNVLGEIVFLVPKIKNAQKILNKFFCLPPILAFCGRTAGRIQNLRLYFRKGSSCRTFAFLLIFAVRRTVWPPYWVICDF